MAQTDQPFSAPRPLIETLPKAVRCAIAAKSQLEEINLTRWAQSYGVTEQDVEAAWIHELTKETNARECGEGK
jgi:hypothetical protein